MKDGEIIFYVLNFHKKKWSYKIKTLNQTRIKYYLSKIRFLKCKENIFRRVEKLNLVTLLTVSI